MSITSLEFLVFVIVTFGIYWLFAGKHFWIQNVCLLLFNCVFFTWPEVQINSFYIVFISAVSYVLGKRIRLNTDQGKKRLLLRLSMFICIGGLVFFKYYAFLCDNIVEVLTHFGRAVSFPKYSLGVPIGISFFTFRVMSYLLDIYYEKVEVCDSALDYFNYVSFFPSLISGPIDRARTFIPQLQKERRFNYAMGADGLKQITWGLFKKIVVADYCSLDANPIFADIAHQSSVSILYGAFLFTIQIYADFSGYSDIAIGTGKLFGFSIAKNFEFPFFAQNIAEFWRKWHISLTSWLTEYLFTPLSIFFRDFGKWGLTLAIVINFLIIGFWHGPQWTYVLFGFLHGIYYVPLILSGKLNKRMKSDKTSLFPSIGELFNIVKTFVLVMLTFLVFKASSLGELKGYLLRLLSFSIFPLPNATIEIAIFVVIMFVVEWLQRSKEHALQIDHIKNGAVRWAIYYAVAFMCIYFFLKTPVNFIYARF